MARRVMTLEQNVGMQNLRNSSTKFEKNKVPVGLDAKILISYPDNDKIFGATSEEDVAPLAKTIRKEGFNQPINVWKMDDGNHMIYSGNRRNSAVLYNGKYYNADTIIQCFVEEYPLSEFERIRKFLDSNLLSRGGIKGLKEHDSITCENISRIIREVFRMLECGKKELKEENKLRKKRGESQVSFDEWFSEMFFSKEVKENSDASEGDLFEKDEPVEKDNKKTMRYYVAKYLRLDNVSYVQNYRNICDCPKEVIEAVEKKNFPVSVASNIAVLPAEKQLLVYDAWCRANDILRERDEVGEVTRDDMLKVVRFVKEEEEISSVEVLLPLLLDSSTEDSSANMVSSEKQSEKQPFERDSYETKVFADVLPVKKEMGSALVDDKTTSLNLGEKDEEPLPLKDEMAEDFDSKETFYQDDEDSSLKESSPKEKTDKKTVTSDEALQKFLKASNSLEELLSDNIDSKYEFDAKQKKLYYGKLDYLESLIISMKKMR